MPKPIIVSAGDVFGKLTVLREFPHSPCAPRMFECRCECGRVKAIMLANLRKGFSRTCGCANIARLTKHGGFLTSEYRSWQHMINRCTNRKYKKWAYYGGRGITVCEEWRASFSAFLDHIGPKPMASYTVERIRNDGNYEPGNVRWATRSEQNRNKRNNNTATYMGAICTLTEISERSGIPFSTLKYRNKRGYTGEALTAPKLQSWHETNRTVSAADRSCKRPAERTPPGQSDQG